MSIEEQIRELVMEELKTQLEEIESRSQRLIEKELEAMKGQLSSIAARMEKIEGEIGKKWNILVRLRRHTLDRLMSEYRKVEDVMRPEREESEEPSEI